MTETIRSKNLIDRVLDRVNVIGALIAGAAMLVMAVIGFADVFFSEVFNSPIPGSYELTETLMVIAVFMAFALNQQRGGNIRVDLLTSMFNEKLQTKFKVFASAVSFVFFLLLSWQAWIFGLASLKVREYESGLIAFPVYPAKILLATGATMIAIQFLRDLIKCVRPLSERQSGN